MEQQTQQPEPTTIFIQPLTEAAKNAFLVQEYRKALGVLLFDMNLPYMIRVLPRIGELVRRVTAAEKAVR